MVLHIQRICLSMFDHFMGLAFKGFILDAQFGDDLYYQDKFTIKSCKRKYLINLLILVIFSQNSFVGVTRFRVIV